MPTTRFKIYVRRLNQEGGAPVPESFTIEADINDPAIQAMMAAGTVTYREVEIDLHRVNHATAAMLGQLQYCGSVVPVNQDVPEATQRHADFKHAGVGDRQFHELCELWDEEDRDHINPACSNLTQNMGIIVTWQLCAQTDPALETTRNFGPSHTRAITEHLASRGLRPGMNLDPLKRHLPLPGPLEHLHVLMSTGDFSVLQIMGLIAHHLPYKSVGRDAETSRRRGLWRLAEMTYDEIVDAEGGRAAARVKKTLLAFNLRPGMKDELEHFREDLEQFEMALFLRG